MSWAHLVSQSQSLCVISVFPVAAAVSVGLILLALIIVLILFKLKHNKHGETHKHALLHV